MSLLLSLPLLGNNYKRPEASNHRLCPGVLSTLLEPDKHNHPAIYRGNRP